MTRWQRTGAAFIAGTAVLAILHVPSQSVVGAAAVQEEQFFKWTKLAFAPEEYRERRARLLRLLAQNGGGVFLAPSRSGYSDGSTFRQLDDFLYFTGLELPDSILAIDADRASVAVFTPLRDTRFENPSRRNDFPGRPLQSDPAFAAQSGIGDIRPAEVFEAFLSHLVDGGRTLRVNLGAGGRVVPVQLTPIQTWTPLVHFVAYLQSRHPGARITNAYDEVADLRMVKSPAELAVIRRAVRLTEQALLETARLVRPGVDERSLEGALEAAYKRGGAQRLGFASIIKSGPNSLWPWRILAAHYDRRNREMLPGELVIFDVGCELDYYISDIGRTFPVSGMFSAEQRRILDMEVAVADAMIREIRPGRTLADVQRAAAATIPDRERRHMATGTYFGHHIGLSSGDPSLFDIPLRPGMVITVEPWYYNHDRQLAVFTEDDILVTADGAENLSAGLPRSPAALERLVKSQTVARR